MNISKVNLLNYANYNTSFFSPTFHPFKNGILINTKKVGTRFISDINSFEDFRSISKFKKDIDLHFCFGQVDNSIENEINKINLMRDEFYVYSSPPSSKYFINKNLIDFLNFTNSNNISELLITPNNDIIFVIKNPIERFFSGITQKIHSLYTDIHQDERILLEILNYTNLKGSDIKQIFKDFNSYMDGNTEIDSQNLNKLQILIRYMLDKRWDFSFSDIHTQNYLHYYMDLIHSIEDKSKIKVIDINQIGSKKGLDFFNHLRGDTLLDKLWFDSEFYEKIKHTNKGLYNDFIFPALNKTLMGFLSIEIKSYRQLIKSPYFIDLSD